MQTEKIVSLTVVDHPDGSEAYRVGSEGVTDIKWGTTPGLHCNLDTVRVFKDGKLFSEHPFTNCLGVYFAQGDDNEA